MLYRCVCSVFVWFSLHHMVVTHPIPSVSFPHASSSSNRWQVVKFQEPPPASAFFQAIRWCPKVKVKIISFPFVYRITVCLLPEEGVYPEHLYTLHIVSLIPAFLTVFSCVLIWVKLFPAVHLFFLHHLSLTHLLLCRRHCLPLWYFLAASQSSTCNICRCPCCGPSETCPKSRTSTWNNSFSLQVCTTGTAVHSLMPPVPPFQKINYLVYKKLISVSVLMTPHLPPPPPPPQIRKTFWILFSKAL